MKPCPTEIEMSMYGNAGYKKFLEATYDTLSIVDLVTNLALLR